jgi:hypothetical protein
MTFGEALDIIRDGGPQMRRTGWPVKDYVEAIYPKSTAPTGDPHLEWRTSLAVIPYQPSNLDLFATDWEAQTPCVKTPITTS